MSIILVDFIDVRDIAIPVPFWVGRDVSINRLRLNNLQEASVFNMEYVCAFHCSSRKFCEPDPSSTMTIRG